MRSWEQRTFKVFSSCLNSCAAKGSQFRCKEFFVDSLFVSDKGAER